MLSMGKEFGSYREQMVGLSNMQFDPIGQWKYIYHMDNDR